MTHRGARHVIMALSTGAVFLGRVRGKRKVLITEGWARGSSTQTHLHGRMGQSQSNLKPGDLIEISRGVFAHWALYVGDGYVVHLAPPGEITSAALANIMSSGTDRAIVKKELLSEVVGNHWYRVNNKHDQKYPPLPPSQIVQRAEEQVGKVMPYKLTSANCEHFVNKLRYGVSYSDQLDNELEMSREWSDKDYRPREEEQWEPGGGRIRSHQTDVFCDGPGYTSWAGPTGSLSLHFTSQLGSRNAVVDNP